MEIIDVPAIHPELIKYSSRYDNLTKQELNCLEAKHKDRIRDLSKELDECKTSLQLIAARKSQL